MMEGRYVKDFMTKDVKCLKPESSVFEAARMFISEEISGAPVVDKDDRLLGIFSEWDCLNVIVKGEFEEFPSGNVSAYMTKDVKTVNEDTGVFEVIQLFTDKRYHRIPVIKDKKLTGIISRRDLLVALTGK